MSAVEIISSLRQVFGTLLEMQKAEAGQIELAPTAAVAGASANRRETRAQPSKFYTKRQSNLSRMWR
jgi:hypothetical protein